MTIYFPDVASFQAGVNLRGARAVIIKATEGASYVNPELGAQLVSARAAGSVIARYHFLYSSRAASISAQARHAFSIASDRPLALDVEEQAQVGSAPSIADVENFIDEYKALGGVLHLVYLPHWYWQQMGSPVAVWAREPPLRALVVGLRQLHRLGLRRGLGALRGRDPGRLAVHQRDALRWREL
jgi:hypothetical protein